MVYFQLLLAFLNLRLVTFTIIYFLVSSFCLRFHRCSCHSVYVLPIFFHFLRIIFCQNGETSVHTLRAVKRLNTIKIKMIPGRSREVTRTENNRTSKESALTTHTYEERKYKLADLTSENKEIKSDKTNLKITSLVSRFKLAKSHSCRLLQCEQYSRKPNIEIKEAHMQIKVNVIIFFGNIGEKQIK